MLCESKSQRQVDSLTDADAAGYEHLPHAKSVVAHLQGRAWIEEVEAVVGRTGQSECLTKPAGSAGQLARRYIRSEAAIAGHLVKPGHGLQCSQQHASSPAILLTGDIHAEIPTIN